MNEITLIRDLAVIWAVALAAGHLFIRLKQPVIAGYMLAGVIVGPHGLKWIDQSEQIKVLAEFGVAMLLFTLGVDLSLKQVMSSARPIVSAGIVQVVGTLGVGWAIAVLTGLAKNPGEGFIFGSICAISSSVVISRTLMDRGELDSVHGRILVPLSLVQDLCLVVIIPFLPVLEDSSGAAWSGLLLSGLKAIVFILIVVVGATRIMPMLLGKSAKANSKEIFL
jgi:CPA2 family monovalent cation:H+ antiporter-2